MVHQYLKTQLRLKRLLRKIWLMPEIHEKIRTNNAKHGLKQGIRKTFEEYPRIRSEVFVQALSKSISKHTVNNTMEELTTEGKISKIANGVYDVPVHGEQGLFKETFLKNLEATNLHLALDKTFESCDTIRKKQVMDLINDENVIKKFGEQRTDNVHNIFSKLEKAERIVETTTRGVYALKGKAEAVNEDLKKARENFDGLASRFEPSDKELDELVLFVHNKMATTGITGSVITDKIFGVMPNSLRKKHPDLTDAQKRVKVNRAVNSRIDRLRKKGVIVSHDSVQKIHAYNGVVVSELIKAIESESAQKSKAKEDKIRSENEAKAQNEKKRIELRQKAIDRDREKKTAQEREKNLTFKLSRGTMTIAQIIKSIRHSDIETEEFKLNNFIFLNSPRADYQRLIKNSKFKELMKKHNL